LRISADFAAAFLALQWERKDDAKAEDRGE